jgi:predicted TPR repeat methyltransferase
LFKAFSSSGDLIADRRVSYARGLFEAGDLLAAAEVMDQVMELVPLWAPGWDLLGSYRERAGDICGAIAAWRHLEALDDAEVFGARLKLAAHGAERADAGTAVSYVEALFDQYAPKFEAALLQKLAYTVPERLDGLLSDVMAAQGLTMLAEAVDLGCGTGLMGERLRQKVSFLEGVDLSAGMLAATANKGIYDRLTKGDLVAFLTDFGARADVLTAADVFIYCGALEPVLAACHAAMRPGGLLAFSLEAHAGPEPVFLRPSLRYAHGVESTRRALTVAGFEILRFEQAALRMDRGEPIEGMLIVVQKSDTAPVVVETEVVAADPERIVN